MFSIIIDKEVPEDIDILLDDSGIEELINYLKFIQKEKDHMHLVVGNELDVYPIVEKIKEEVINVKHARLQYMDSKKWNQK